VGYSQSLPDWDAVMFTFRGRDQDPRTPSTLGAWERRDVAAVVAFLEARGAGRRRLLLVGVSQGAGVALLALRDLEASGQPLGGALLESPFRDLGDAARNHLRGVLGRGVVFAVPALEAAIRIAGRRARFDPVLVSPLVAARGLKTPVALLAGDADAITPLEGVRALAVHLTDLTVVSGAGHCEAGARVPGGWGAWAQVRVARWFGDR
jgi:pimeloyl-ACP methyl ester carboxylesterase